MAKTRVEVARKLAIILHRMWRDYAEFRWASLSRTRRRCSQEHEEARTSVTLRGR